MTQEDKQLLLKDLCARLPYSPFVQLMEKFDDEDSEYFREIHNLSTYDIELFNSGEISSLKPYLKPLSSMTDEEREAFIRIGVEHSLQCIKIDNKLESFVLRVKFHKDELEYLLERQYDVYGLIPMGLAIEVTENNNPYKL